VLPHVLCSHQKANAGSFRHLCYLESWAGTFPTAGFDYGRRNCVKPEFGAGLQFKEQAEDATIRWVKEWIDENVPDSPRS